MTQVQMPQGFFWQTPPTVVPVRAIGATVTDAAGQLVANCPNSSLADVVAYHINLAYGVHSGSSPCFPYGTPEPGQRNADDMGYPPTSR